MGLRAKADSSTSNEAATISVEALGQLKSMGFEGVEDFGRSTTENIGDKTSKSESGEKGEGNTDSEKLSTEKEEAEKEEADGISKVDGDGDSDTGAVYELLHNGEKKEIRESEIISLAQKGYDYTQK